MRCWNVRRRRCSAHLAATPKTFERLLGQGDALPLGMSLPCPSVPDETDVPWTERYIEMCKEAFRPRMHDEAAFYYLRGAEDFRALRAAVLALTDMTGRTSLQSCMPEKRDA